MTTAQPRPNSLSARDAKVLLHPYTNAIANERDGPLVMTRGEGVYVYDEDGNRYIEGMAGLWCLSLGFGNERLAEAAAAQIRKLSFYHGFNQKGHEPQIELAERLLDIAPDQMSKTFFFSKNISILISVMGGGGQVGTKSVVFQPYTVWIPWENRLKKQ